MQQSWLNGIYGGLLIGLAASLLLITYGRVLGVSGILDRIYGFTKGDTFWRVMFVAGIIAGGFVGSLLWPENFAGIIADNNYLRFAVAGILVGFGTKMGKGCTSGHGICGIGRLSRRGIAATCTFIFTGILTVLILGR